MTAHIQAEAVASLWLVLCIDWVWVQQKRSSEDVTSANLKKYFPNLVNRTASRNSKSLQRKLAHVSENNCTPRPSGWMFWDVRHLGCLCAGQQVARAHTPATAYILCQHMCLSQYCCFLKKEIYSTSQHEDINTLPILCSLNLHEPFYTV